MERLGNYVRLGSRHTAAAREKLSLSHLGHVVSTETRIKIGLGLRGHHRPVAPETREKISLSLRGHKTTRTTQPLRKDGHGVRWMGDAAGYHAIHRRVRHLFSSLPCMACGGTSKVVAALIKGCGGKWNRRTGIEFSSDVQDYLPLCPRCHKIYDCEPLPW
jgi:hypothetical protein